MIFLDTNFLIAAMVPHSPADRQLRHWIAAGETPVINVMVWAEFLCGPLTVEAARLACTIFPNPEPLSAQDAQHGAELFNTTGRRRGSLADCLIAATCLRLNVAIATLNVNDFAVFEPLGLLIARLPTGLS